MTAQAETTTLRVIKRDGSAQEFNAERIRVAVAKAIIAVEGEQAGSERLHQLAERIADHVGHLYQTRLGSGAAVHIEDIQDQVELALMRHGEQKIARAYILYREERARGRAAAEGEYQPHPTLYVVQASGEQSPLDLGWLRQTIAHMAEGLNDIDTVWLENETLDSVYDGVGVENIEQALLLSARSKIELEPDYSRFCARLLLKHIKAEVAQSLGVDADDQGAVLKKAIELGIPAGRIDAKLGELFDLDAIGAALQPERDNQFQYLGLQIVNDRYLLNIDGGRIELPQTFYMRVAMGLALNEDKPTERAIEFYELLSSFDYMASTPTLFNAGTQHSQLSSCYLTTVPDDLSGIYEAMRDNALLSKWAGGLGNDWTPVRSLGAHIHGTNGHSQGVVPFLKVANDTAVAVNQGGKRKGAVCAYLESWHLDIEEFLELRKNTGDDRRRTHDMNTANWVPDLLMERVLNDGDWTLFSPNDVPDLHDLYGNAFRQAYEAYEDKARSGEIKLHRVIKAGDLWKKMLSMLFETGHPWITFKDACNLRSPQQHAGVVHSSNLCTEITLNTSEDEIAVCNLGSVNIVNHIMDGKIDHARIRRTVKTAVRMLDNVIDINFYAVPQAKNSNLRHRPVGLGMMGFQDALYKLGIAYASDEAVEFADRITEEISYVAIDTSADLAQERGAYGSFDGSLWSKGILPIDSIELLAAARDEQHLRVDRSQRLDWASVRTKAKQGMRNSNVLAIAPTATIANIIGVSQSIEPTYQNLYVKSNLSGEFTIVNPHLVHDLKAEGLWDAVMVNDLKFHNGSVLPIKRIPEHLREKYRTAFEVEPRWLVECGSRRQKWLDQAQSLNLYIDQPDGRKLDITYKMAWLTGLKTTYYLRAMGATAAEKSTVSQNQLNSVSADPEPKMCLIDDPECEACQ